MPLERINAEIKNEEKGIKLHNLDADSNNRSNRKAVIVLRVYVVIRKKRRITM